LSLRILHTSDGHLGLATGAVSRHEDHRRFLDGPAREPLDGHSSAPAICATLTTMPE